MGQFLSALKLIPPANWLRVVGPFIYPGQLSTAPASLPVIRLFSSATYFIANRSPGLASEEFERRQFFSNRRYTHVFLPPALNT